jgi:tetratricopeptide (TPR) repeat protein
VATYKGQVEEAARFSRESVDIYGTLGAQAELAFSLTMLAGSFLLQGRFAEARSRVLAAIGTYEEIGLRHAYSAMPRLWLGLITWASGDYQQARQELEFTLSMAEETDWKRGAGACLLGLGAISLVEGTPEQALRLLEESAASLQAIKQIDDYAWALAVMGYVECELGRIPQAREHLLEALRLGAEVGALVPVVFALPGIALLWAHCGQVEGAAELYALASCQPVISDWHWFEDIAGQQIAAAAAALPPDTVAAARARGRARDMNSTIAELLAELEGEEITDG